MKEKEIKRPRRRSRKNHVKNQALIYGLSQIEEDLSNHALLTKIVKKSQTFGEAVSSSEIDDYKLLIKSKLNSLEEKGVYEVLIRKDLQ